MQWYSVRGMKMIDPSRFVPSVPGMAVKNDGQPVPLLNFIAEVNSGSPQPAQANTPARFSRSSGLV